MEQLERALLDAIRRKAQAHSTAQADLDHEIKAATDALVRAWGPHAHSPEEESCAICAGSVAAPVGRLPCAHGFCFACVLEWSCMKNECPLCKRTFNEICVQHADGRRTTEHVATPVSPEELERKAFEETKCLVCHTAEREHLLLLCDQPGCTVSCHTDCCDPPLRSVPDGEWLCPKCRPRPPRRRRLQPLAPSTRSRSRSRSPQVPRQAPRPVSVLNAAQRQQIEQSRLRALARKRAREMAKSCA